MLLIIAGGTPDCISLLFPMLDCVLIFPTVHQAYTHVTRTSVSHSVTERVAVMSGRWLSLAVCVSVCGIRYHIPPQRPLHRKKLHVFLPPL